MRIALRIRVSISLAQSSLRVSAFIASRKPCRSSQTSAELGGLHCSAMAVGNVSGPSAAWLAVQSQQPERIARERKRFMARNIAGGRGESARRDSCQDYV
jgi:hypothetical protein